MTSTLTTNKNIEKPAYNDYATNPTGWSGPVNTDWDIVDRSLGGAQVKNPTGISGTVDLTVVECQPPILIIGTSISGTATLTANILYRIPSGVGGVWTVYNNTSGTFTISIGSAGGGTSVAVAQGYHTTIYSDGTNVRLTDDKIGNAAGSNTQIQFNNNGTFGAASSFVYNAGNVGIGTASPVYPLDVSGSIQASSQIINTSGGYKFPDNTVQLTAAQTVIPSTTRMLFFQAAAPTGWTQYTLVNDRALRVVSGTGAGTGGTTAYSTYFAGTFNVGSTAITSAQMPSHTHDVVDPGHLHVISSLFASNFNFSGSGGSVTSWDPATTPNATKNTDSATTGITIAATGGGEGHVHTIPSLQYADVIICTKD